MARVGEVNGFMEGCLVKVGRKPEEFSKEQRQQLHRAHQSLRNASHALEALTVVEPVRGRWVPTPAPVEALEAAQNDLYRACQEFWRVHQELLRCDPPAGVRPARSVASGYGENMTDKDADELAQQAATEAPSPSELAQALKAVKSSSPELAAKLDAAKVNPEELADAHERATSEESGPPQG